MAEHNGTKWEAVTNWAALRGTWTFRGNNADYTPQSIPGGFGLALCDERFKDGNIKSTMRLHIDDCKTESGGIVLGYHPETQRYLVAGLGAFEAAYAIWEFDPGLGWVGRRLEGSSQNLKPNHNYALHVVQRGQRISLSVDNVPVIEHLLPSPLAGNQLGLYAMTRGQVSFEGFQVERKPPVAFVAMQFGEPYDTVYRTAIRHIAKKLGFDVMRIDEVKRPGIIFQDIQQKIEDAKVVIAEITAPNQNVYYEVGYSHALNKPTILLAQRGRDLPFDIRSYRVIFYDDSIGGKPAVERDLREHLHAILKDL